MTVENPPFPSNVVVENNDGSVDIKSNGVTAISIMADGNIIIHNLPTIDPSINGALFLDGTRVFVSVV